jgi:RNA polymerase sigma-70 factor (ECF subfamily)
MVLDSMPPLERAMLALAYFEQLSYGEMSEALGVPEGTVASRLYKAKESFRRLWGEQ